MSLNKENKLSNNNLLEKTITFTTTYTQKDMIDCWETAVNTFRECIDNPELYEQHKKEYLKTK